MPQSHQDLSWPSEGDHHWNSKPRPQAPDLTYAWSSWWDHRPMNHLWVLKRLDELDELTVTNIKKVNLQRSLMFFRPKTSCCWIHFTCFTPCFASPCLASTKRSVPTVQFLYWGEEANEAGTRPWSLAHTSGLQTGLSCHGKGWIHTKDWEIPSNGITTNGEQNRNPSLVAFATTCSLTSWQMPRGPDFLGGELQKKLSAQRSEQTQERLQMVNQIWWVRPL